MDKKQAFPLYRDIGVSLVFLAGCAVLYKEALSIEGMGFDVLGAQYMPLLMIRAAAFLSLILLIRSLVLLAKRRLPKEKPLQNERRYLLKSLVCLGLSVVYIVSLGTGLTTFITATPVYMTACASVLMKPKIKSYLIFIPVALIFSFGLDYLFNDFLLMELP